MTPNTFDPEAAMSRTRAILRGHFKLASGNHSSVYFQCARLLAVPAEADAAGAALAGLWSDDRVESVLAPALGGVVLAYIVARALGVPGYFAERNEERGFALRRGFQLARGERVLVVEDVLTTGGSAARVVDLVTALGATPVGIGAIVNRGGYRHESLPVRATWNLDAPIYEPASCPLCASGVAVEKPGSTPEKVS